MSSPSSGLIDRSPSGDLLPPPWGKPRGVPGAHGGGRSNADGIAVSSLAAPRCGNVASWPSSGPSPTDDFRVGEDDVGVLGHGAGVPAKDGEGMETRLTHHGRTVSAEIPRANQIPDTDFVGVKVGEERRFEEDDADHAFASLGHSCKHQPRCQSSAEQSPSHQSLRPEHSNRFLGSVDSHNGPPPAPTDPALPPVAATVPITTSPPTTKTTTPVAPLWETVPTATLPLGAAAGGEEVAAAAVVQPLPWGEEDSRRRRFGSAGGGIALGHANTPTTAEPNGTSATTTLEPFPPTSNRDTTTSSTSSSSTARLERSRLGLRTPSPLPLPSQSDWDCHESQKHTYDLDCLNNNKSSSSNCSDPAFSSPSTAATATNRSPPTTPPPTLPPTDILARSELRLLHPRSRDAMGHGPHEPPYSVVLLPTSSSSTPSGLSVSVVVSSHHNPQQDSAAPLSPLPQSDMEPHERFPTRDPLHNNNSNNNNSSTAGHSPASCGPTNEGKHRDSGDWDESRNAFDNDCDDDTVTVQSFDSATVVASPALMPQMGGRNPVAEAEAAAHNGAAAAFEAASSLWANPSPTDREEGALEATPTTSASTTDLDADDASLGNLMSLERSFLLEETQGLVDGNAEDEPSFLLLDSDVASPVGNDQQHHYRNHHRRVPSWEGLLPRVAPYQGTVSYDDHDLARLFRVPPPAASSSTSLSPPAPTTTTTATPWPSQQRVTSFRASHNQPHYPYHPHQHSHSGGGGGGGNSFGSFGYQDRYTTESTGWQPPTTTTTQHQHQRHHSQSHLQQQQQQQQPMFVGASPPVPFLPPGRGTPPIDNRAGGMTSGGGTRTPYHHQPYPSHHHPYLQQQQQQQQHTHHPYLPQQQHPYHPQHPHQPTQVQHPQSQSPAPRMPGYVPHAQMSPSVGATPPRRGPPRGGQPPPSPGPHRPGYGASGGGGPLPSLAGGGGGPSAAMAGAGGARSASEVLKTLLRKKACLYEADTSRAVALVTWLVGRELALERGYFSRQQLQAGVHACVANKIDAGVITRTKVNRCMQIILNSCFHYIIPRPDGTEESGESFGRIFAAEADDDSVLLQILPDPWTHIVVDRERVLQAAEQADWEAKAGAAVSSATSSNGAKKGSEFVTPQSSPRLTSATPDKGSPGGRDSLDGDDGTKRAVLLCFNENVRRAEDVFRCHNEFIRDTAHGSHLQLSSHEWRSFFGAEAASAPHLWGNVGIPVPCNEESNGRSRVDALGMMTPDETGKFRSTWCTKRYEHDHDLCGFAHVEVNGGWLRRNPLVYQYKDDLCPFVSTITDKHSGQVLFVINECPLGTDCELAHSSEEMMYHPRRYKMRACPASGRPGGCGLGDVCPNFHPTDTYRFPKKSEGRSSRHSKYSHAAGAAKGGPPTTPSGAPILMASPAPLSSFEEHLHLPGLRSLYRRQCSVVRAHLRQRGSTCVYGYFGDDDAAQVAAVVPDDARTAPAPPVVRGLPPRA